MSHMAGLDSKLVNVVGDRTAKVLDSVFGYKTLSDLIHHYPRRYLVRGELSDIAELKEGDEVISGPYFVVSKQLKEGDKVKKMSAVKPEEEKEEE